MLFSFLRSHSVNKVYVRMCRRIEGGKLLPCSPGDTGAVEMSWLDVPSEQLAEPKLSMVRK